MSHSRFDRDSARPLFCLTIALLPRVGTEPWGACGVNGNGPPDPLASGLTDSSLLFDHGSAYNGLTESALVFGHGLTHGDLYRLTII